MQIECRDAFELIPRYDALGTLIYCDPPYPQSTRSQWKGKAYAHELSDDEHCRLAELLHACSAYVIISSYPSELYSRLYRDWRRIDLSVQTNSRSMVRTECLWLSPSTVEALGGLFGAFN